MMHIKLELRGGPFDGEFILDPSETTIRLERSGMACYYTRGSLFEYSGDTWRWMRPVYYYSGDIVTPTSYYQART